MQNGGFSITPSDIIQHLYCPRFTWWERAMRLPQYEEKNYKVMRGRDMHDQKSGQNEAYLRRKLGVESKQVNVYLTNDLLRGEVDEVLFLQDGTAAPLDYKFARWEEKLYDTYRTQLLCYAWLIEERFGKKVNRGYLVYTRSKHHVEEVAIAGADIASLKIVAESIRTVIEKNEYPKATRVRSRCVHCTYRNVCTQ